MSYVVKVRKQKDYTIYKSKINGVAITCVEDKRSLHDCDTIISEIRDMHIKNAEELYIAPKKWLLNRFDGDEMVEYRLNTQKSLGMNRNDDAHDMDEEIPRQIIAVTDHERFENLLGDDINTEILKTVVHENAHLSGILGEGLAEREAIKWEHRRPPSRSSLIREEELF